MNTINKQMDAAELVERRYSKAKARVDDDKAARQTRTATQERRLKSRQAAQRVVPAVEAATFFENDLAVFKLVEVGTIKRANGNWRVKLTSEQKKAALANYCPGLEGKYRVINVPAISQDGRRLDAEERAQALVRALDGWVPITTMSGLKSGLVYAIPRPVFEEWIKAGGWDIGKDGRKFAVYANLVFSDIAAEPVMFKNTPVEVAPDGKDGGCNADILAVFTDWWSGKRSGQFRGMELRGGFPVSFVKGTISQFKGHGQMRLNDTQVKLGRKPGSAGDFYIAPCEVNSRLSKSWISAEPLLQLRDDPKLRVFLTARVRAVVNEMLSLVSENRRADLLERLGGLELGEDYELKTERRAILDMIASNVPWCSEMETRITRFMIREITQHVIPSGAIEADCSMAVISDQYGARIIDVGPNDDIPDGAVVVFRLPCNGPENIVFLNKNPYVKGVGMVVHSEVMKDLEGDDDGDLILVVRDREVMALFAIYRDMRLVGQYKPEKSKIESPLTADAMTDFVLEQWADSWLVGGLTVASWKLAQAGKVKAAAKMGYLAKIAPMTMKHHLVLNGRAFHEVVRFEYGAAKEAYKLDKIKLQWHEAMKLAKNWRSPRELAAAQIRKPKSHLDACWNAGVAAAQEWAAANPLQKLSLTTVRKLSIAVVGYVSSIDMMGAKEFRKVWGEYWTEQFANGRKPAPGYNHPIFAAAVEWARNATVGELASMLQWMPVNPESDGFAIKFHTVFAAGRGREVLGLHPAIKERVIAKRGWAAGYIKQIDAVNAYCEAFTTDLPIDPKLVPAINRHEKGMTPEKRAAEIAALMAQIGDDLEVIDSI